MIFYKITEFLMIFENKNLQGFKSLKVWFIKKANLFFTGAMSINFMNSSSLGMMMISVLRFSARPETEALVVLGLYSLLPPAVILLGF